MALNQLTYEQISQVRENSTSFVSIYSPNPNETVQLYIKISNTSDDDVQLWLCHDHDGTTYDESTSLFWGTYIPPGETLEIDHIFCNDSTGNIAYKSGAANALTATVYMIMRSSS